MNVPTDKGPGATFEDCVPPAVAAAYRSLGKNRRLRAVFADLKRRGLSERHIEVLMCNVAWIPSDWQQENEPIKRGERRRAALARKLSALANEIASDRDLSGLCYGIHTTSLNAPPDDRKGMQTLAELMKDAARSLEPYTGPIRKIGSGALVQPPKMEKHEPAKNIQAFALRRVYRLLEPYFKNRRAPNLAAETIVSVLLGKAVKRGTLTQLRRNEGRRRYGRGQ